MPRPQIHFIEGNPWKGRAAKAFAAAAIGVAVWGAVNWLAQTGKHEGVVLSDPERVASMNGTDAFGMMMRMGVQSLQDIHSVGAQSFAAAESSIAAQTSSKRELNQKESEAIFDCQKNRETRNSFNVYQAETEITYKKFEALDNLDRKDKYKEFLNLNYREFQKQRALLAQEIVRNLWIKKDDPELTELERYMIYSQMSRAYSAADGTGRYTPEGEFDSDSKNSVTQLYSNEEIEKAVGFSPGELYNKRPDAWIAAQQAVQLIANMQKNESLNPMVSENLFTLSLLVEIAEKSQWDLPQVELRPASVQMQILLDRRYDFTSEDYMCARLPQPTKP